MKIRLPNWVKRFFRRCIIYSQELVLAAAWLAFAVSSNAPLTVILEVEYPRVVALFHIVYAMAGLFMILAVAFPKYFAPAWVFSAVVAMSAYIATVNSTPGTNYSLLYPITWGLFFIVSATQSLRHYRYGDRAN